MSGSVERDSPPWVYCPELEAIAEDPITFTRVWGGTAHCSYCGATDHKEVTDPVCTEHN